MINAAYLLEHPELIPALPPLERLKLATATELEILKRDSMKALRRGDMDEADGLVAEQVRLSGRLQMINLVLSGAGRDDDGLNGRPVVDKQPEIKA